MKHRQSGCTQEAASAKTGISIRSGRRVEKGEIATAGERHWRTRKDPFKTVWESELVPILEREPSLTGITLWDYLDERYPDQYPERLLRTLQRRVKHWQATEGPDQDVIEGDTVTLQSGIQSSRVRIQPGPVGPGRRGSRGGRERRRPSRRDRGGL